MLIIPEDRDASQGLLGMLPNELVLMIREAYPASDLVFHARFDQLSEHVPRLYDADTDFWRRLCYSNGIGCLKNEESRMMNWKALALECELHTRICYQPGCGEAKLSENTTWTSNRLRQKEPIVTVRASGQSVKDTRPYSSHDDLNQHIIALRSFACFPPVDNMQVNLFTTTTPSLCVNNVSGATVHDIQDGINIVEQYEYTLSTLDLY
ncbi:hypothetical protein PHLGIDRAFT_16137 [Phlebiopsis gigantea 11061_1 CR5-6]|uniref:Uncharacterized protein n=1 Tax=Phlebiopsis gigantea (strain 11061_1 CR5-6) TaxID=745531 RepID=A0A0C3RS19_PHLG1|nr:hypothetical protein PHLGIDRAFT_16137 [Phlebiopsis gigantea 11061_1 CR5-6]